MAYTCRAPGQKREALRCLDCSLISSVLEPDPQTWGLCHMPGVNSATAHFPCTFWRFLVVSLGLFSRDLDL